MKLGLNQIKIGIYESENTGRLCKCDNVFKRHYKTAAEMLLRADKWL